MGSDVGQIFLTASLHWDHSILYALVCENEISHPRGRINSDPEGEISLSYMDMLMMDCFSPTFEGFLLEKKYENFNFLLVGFKTFLSL